MLCHSSLYVFQVHNTENHSLTYDQKGMTSKLLSNFQAKLFKYK